MSDLKAGLTDFYAAEGKQWQVTCRRSRFMDASLIACVNVLYSRLIVGCEMM